jgi:hypothetical protein
LARKSKNQEKREKLWRQWAKRKRKTCVQNPEAGLTNLTKAFSKYWQRDLCANIAGLQLIPENHTHTLRLEIAARIACSMNDRGEKTVELGQLCKELNESIPSNGVIGRMEDPVESLFTENIIFHGGNHIVYSGLVDGGSFILNNLLKAIFHPCEEFTNGFREVIRQSTMALLTLSTVVANRMGHARNLVSPDTWRKDIYMPSSEELERGRFAVQFSEKEIETGLRRIGVRPESLAPFIILPGDATLKFENPDKNPLCAKPLVKINDMVVFVQPGSVTSAIRHFIMITAQNMGLLEKLSKEYRRMLDANTQKCLDRIFFEKLDISLPQWEEELPVTEGIYRIDTDKLSYVQTVVDDATNYHQEEIFGKWDTRPFWPKIEERKKKIVDLLLKQSELNISQILVLIVFRGIGRFSVFGFGNLPENTRDVALLGDELEIVANLRKFDNLTFWKYAGARDKLLKTFPKCLGIASFLDTYALYLNKHHSFYLSDEGPAIPVIFPGDGHHLRVESAMTGDIHAQLFRPKNMSSRYITVTRRYEGDPIPVYILYDALSPFIKVIEGYEQPLWVMRDDSERYSARNLGDIYLNITDLVAYWLWQVTPSLKSHLKVLGKTPINIFLQIERPSRWEQFDLSDGTDFFMDFICEVDQFDIIFTIPDGIQVHLRKADNEADRLILDEILKSFNKLLEVHGKAQTLTKEVRQDIVNRHAPLGPKKMMNLFEQERAALNPENLPLLRKLQEHDLEEQLDGLVEALNLGTLSIGEIKENKKKLEVVGRIVDLYIDRLRTTLSQFNWQSSLEQFIANCEAAHNRRVVREVTMATDIACFSDIKSRIEREIEEKSNINSSSLATRTLIEFIAAEPPSGKKIPSKEDMDKLLAIAFQLVNWGSYYDQIELGLFEHHLSILPSGRIGRDPQPFDKFRGSFYSEKIREGVEYAVDNYAENIEPEEEKKSSFDLAEINNAFVAEFGLTIEEATEFHYCLTDIGFQQKTPCARLPISKLKEKIKEKTHDIPDWTDEKIEIAIQLYSLKTRERWDKVPKEFLKDIYPWRYTRRLSYMSKPLIIGPGDNNDPLVFWGPRHVDESVRLLFSNISKGRYKIHEHSSEVMKKLLGHVLEKTGEEFNQKAREWLENNTNWPLKTKVPINPGTLLKSELDLGDVDILAVDCPSRKIYSIECKHINSSRNPREMANELERFFTDENGQDAWIEKHVKRHEWLTKNLATVSSLFKIDLSSYTVSSLFLTSEEIPTPYLRSMPLPFKSFPRLRRQGVDILKV